FLKRMGQESKKRLGLIEGTIRRIKDADSEMDLKIAARDLASIPGIPSHISRDFQEKAGSLGVSRAGLQAAYNDAMVAMDNKDYAKAYKSLIRLGDYKNSRELLKKIKPLVLSEGQSVLFGSWYINTSGPKSPIEWVVLRRRGDRALLISRFVLFCAAFNREPVDTDWEHCSLRTWLGTGFLNDAFTAGEQNLIDPVRLKNEQNPVLLTPGCGDTVDRVFLLSYGEAQELFATDADRLCQATPYAVAMGAQYSPGAQGNCLWWLRTPGIGKAAVSFVAPAKGQVQTGDSETFADFKEGECVSTGQGASIKSGGVRPALWIRL
ncbi:MAG: hypothetical protein IJT95_01135, partial [Abditibacteriota bacterium]|nr:hypothetical protein [Abditibacteriota bacterium]